MAFCHLAILHFIAVPYSSGHFVYMLRCKGERIYTGYATNVEARYRTHCAGTGARFTRAFPPESILRVFTCFDKSAALRLEACLKSIPKEAKERLAQAAPTDESMLPPTT